MKKHLLTKSTTLVLAIVFATFALGPQVEAVNVFTNEACNGDTSICSGNRTELTNIIATVVNLMIFIAGIIAVIMIVVGGIKYVLSSGDSNAVTSAKNTVLYAVIGLVVAVMAFAIVNFVLNQFLSQPTGGSSQQEGEGGEEGGGGATPAPRPAPIPPGV